MVGRPPAGLAEGNRSRVHLDGARGGDRRSGILLPGVHTEKRFRWGGGAHRAAPGESSAGEDRGMAAGILRQPVDRMLFHSLFAVPGPARSRGRYAISMGAPGQLGAAGSETVLRLSAGERGEHRPRPGAVFRERSDPRVRAVGGDPVLVLRVSGRGDASPAIRKRTASANAGLSTLAAPVFAAPTSAGTSPLVERAPRGGRVLPPSPPGG